MMEKTKKKFDFKKFCKDYAYEIGFAVSTTVLIGAGGWWVWHVKRNTTELTKLDIPNGKCFQHYRQFGKTYMNGESDLSCVGTFVQGLLESGHFKDSDKMLFMITDDGGLFK